MMTCSEGASTCEGIGPNHIVTLSDIVPQNYILNMLEVD